MDIVTDEEQSSGSTILYGALLIFGGVVGFILGYWIAWSFYVH